MLESLVNALALELLRLESMFFENKLENPKKSKANNT